MAAPKRRDTNQSKLTMGFDSEASHREGDEVPRLEHSKKIYKKRAITGCPHTDKPYYAKGMCVNCYHRLGRSKKAWKCPHKTVTHYSKGLCKYCYLASYYKSRTVKRSRKGSSQTSQQSKSANSLEA